MTLFKHMPPRRVILTLIILSGLGLRLWGLAWGSGLKVDLNPHEWVWQVIDRLSPAEPTYPGVWNQTFYSLAAILRGLLSLVAGWLAVWLGEARTLAEVALSARLAGRLAVALMGTGQIWLVYLLGRRAFGSVATGLLAAAVLAVSPLMVSHGHYLSLEVPLGFMVLWCLWLAWDLVEIPGAGRFLLAGFALGLTVTTAPAGLAMAPVLAGAYVMALVRHRPGALKGTLAWPFSLLAGLVLGLALGFPGLILEPDTWRYSLEQGLSWPQAPVGGWVDQAWRRLTRLWSQWLGVGGLELVGLWLVGLGFVLWRRNWARLLVALTPPILLAVSLAGPGPEMDGQQVVWLPAAAVLACWPLVLLCRQLPRYGWQVAGVAILGVGLCAWPLWRSLGVGYLFWQQDSLGSAASWLESNLTGGQPLVAGPGAPLSLATRAKPWQRGQTAASMVAEGEWLILSHETGPPATPRPPDSLASGLQAVKNFDLTKGWGLGRLTPPERFPRWVSPPVAVYAPASPTYVAHRLAVARPLVGVERPYAVIYPELPDYSRDDGAVLIETAGRGHRVLRQGGLPSAVGVDLANLGQDLVRGRVTQGPWERASFTLYPGQRTSVKLSATAWPPMVEGVYPVRITLERGGPVLAHLSTDPLILARRALSDGRLAEARDLLLPGAGPLAGFDHGAMLANVLARLGAFQEASRVLGELSGNQGQPAASYQELATAGDTGPLSGADWDRALGQVTGYIPWLLRQSTSLTYRVDGPLCQSRGQNIPLQGRGYSGSYLRTPGKPGGYLRLWLNDYFPAAGLAARLRLSVEGRPAARRELAAAEIWGHGPDGSVLLAKAPILARDLPGGKGEVSLPLLNPALGTRLEVRLLFTSVHELALESLTMEVDMKAHMRRMLLWYFEAWGLVSLEAKRYAAAAEAFQKVLDLDPEDSAAILPLCRALIDSGKLDEAHRLAKRAEARFADMPGPLTRVADIYQALGKPEQAQHVETRLAYLRPSLHHQSRLAGGLTLLGYDLPAAEVKPGGSLETNYYWQVWEKPAVNYYVFVHLVGPETTLNYDHLLDHGRLSMTGLRPGQVVREDYRLNIPPGTPPGSYRLIVGLWDPRFTGKRVQVLEGEDAGNEEVTLGTVQVR